MEFEWNETKSAACEAERGFDFAYACQVFLDARRKVRPDRRYDYGEPRYEMVGSIAGRVYVVIYTLRGSRIRIISARKANQREVQHYETHQA